MNAEDTSKTGNRNDRQHRRPVRLVAVAMVAAIFGWGLCEGLLRLLVPPTIFYSRWFTAGVHQPDDEFGFVFRPHFDGAMRHADQVWIEPLKLDRRGFRLPARAATDPNESPAVENRQTTRVALLGGASMAFCYGLPDSQCLHHQIAKRVSGPCQLDLLSWPGFTVEQDLRKLQTLADPTDYDIAIVFAYDDRDYRPAGDLTGETPPVRWWHSVALPPDPAADLFPRLYPRSYVVAALCRVMDQFRSRLIPAPPAPVSHGAHAGSSQEVSAARSVAERVHAMGIERVMLVALPHQVGVHGPGELDEANPDWLEQLDLRDTGASPDWDWIAAGHYGPQSSHMLARRIAPFLVDEQENIGLRKGIATNRNDARRTR